MRSLAPNASPNASQWNMVCVAYARVGFALGIYILCCLCQFHARWVLNANPFFFVEYELLGSVLHWIGGSDLFGIYILDIVHSWKGYRGTVEQ